jgi:hypothetical protein
MPEFLLEGLLMVGCAALVSVLAQLSSYIKFKRGLRSKSEAGFLLSQAAMDAVTQVAQTLTDDLKKAATDGKLTKLERLDARTKAIDQCKAFLGPSGVALVVESLGIDPLRIEEVLGQHVEAAVHKLSERRAERQK